MRSLFQLRGVSTAVTLGLAILLFGKSASNAWGQADAQPATAASGAASGASNAADVKGPPCMALDFPGGTVKAYYDALKKAWPKAEFMLHADLERIAMPPVKFDCIVPTSAASMVSDMLPGVECKFTDSDFSAGRFSASVRVNREFLKDLTQSANQKYDLDFDGGAIGQLLFALQQKAGGRLNITLAPKAGEARLPALYFKGATIQSILDAACRASVIEGYELGLSGNDTLWQINAVSTGAGASPGMSFSTIVQSKPYPITALVTDKQTLDDVMAAIQTMMDLSGEKVVMKYHKETGMLMVRATAARQGELSELLQSLQQNTDLVQRASQYWQLQQEVTNLRSLLESNAASAATRAAPSTRPTTPERSPVIPLDSTPSTPPAQPEAEKPN